MRRAQRVIGVVALAVGSALAATGVPARADTVESGWWWKGNAGATAPLPDGAPVVNLPAPPPAAPAPPTVPDGGLLVAASADGAVAIAAVRTQAPATALVLKPAPDGDTGGALAHLLACLPSGPWTPAAGGRWDDKPIVACDLANGGGSVAGVRAADGSWSFAVGPLVRDGVTDVVIVPAADPANPGAPIAPFQLAFEKPGADAFAVAGGEPPASGTGDGGPADVAAPADPAPGFGAFGPLPASPDLPALPAERGFVAAPALPRSAQAPRRPAATPALATTRVDDRGARAAGMAVLFAGLAALLAAGRAPAPALAGLGRLRRAASPAGPGTAVGGLGRFARPRTGPAPRL